MITKIKKFSAGISKKECTEFGQVATLISLFLALYQHNNQWVAAAFAFIFITIVLPIVLYPATVIWFGLSQVLGAVSSKILMSIVFILIVIPVGLFRKLLGNDNLKIHQFKKGTKSVMIERNHVFTDTDLTNTF